MELQSSSARIDLLDQISGNMVRISFMIQICLFWYFLVRIIYINSDIPYMQHSNMYQIIRTGRISWALGQLGGTFFRSFILVVFTAFCSIVSLLPQIEWSLQWGKLIHTIAMTNAAISIIWSMCLLSDFRKIFTITINDHYNSHMHIYFHVFKFLNVYDKLIFQPHCSLNYSSINDNAIFVVNIHPKIRYILAKFIPTVWAKVVQVNSPVLGYYWVPSIKYMFAFLLIGNIILIILILIKVKKCEFNWENEDI